MRRAGLAALLGLVYLVMTGSVTAAGGAVGLVIGGAVVAACGLGGARGERWQLRRLVALPVFLAGVCRELAAGSWAMLRVLLGPGAWRRAGFVEAPVSEQSPRAAIVSSLVASAAPGNLVVDIDHHRQVLIVNAIDATDPDRVRADLARFYRRFQRPFLP